MREYMHGKHELLQQIRELGVDGTTVGRPQDMGTDL